MQVQIKMDNTLSNMYRNTNTRKSIELPYYTYDKIYKSIELNWHSKLISEHYIFKRMKDIKQLGPLRFKFTNASHSRFEHSLGVAYLARSAALYLQSSHPNITDEEVMCVEIAGLFHDIGHGPYSHSFDQMLEMIDSKKVTDKHEVRSIILAKYVMEDIRNQNSTFHISDDQIRLIQFFIDPIKYIRYFGDLPMAVVEKSEQDINKYKLMPKLPSEPAYDLILELPGNLPKFTRGLEQIVNNVMCKFDVDKIDYILRDASYLGYDSIMRSDLDIQSMLKRSRIINDTWVFHIKDKITIEELIHRRYLFYTNNYVHPDVNAINCMLTDALKKLNTIINFTQYAKLETKEDIDNYALLTDDYFQDLILNNHSNNYSNIRDLFERIIKQKDLYRGIGQRISTDEVINDEYCRVPWNLFNDKSHPNIMLKLVKYHESDKIVNPDDIKFVNIIYGKSPVKPE